MFIKTLYDWLIRGKKVLICIAIALRFEVRILGELSLLKISALLTLLLKRH